MVVIDASAVVDFLADGPKVPRLAQIILSGRLHAVTFIDLEVMHAFRRLLIRREMSENRAKQALLDFHALSITRHAHEPLLHRIWDLRHNITAYDAAYVALAEKLDLPLVTRDARLARAAGHTARIEHIA